MQQQLTLPMLTVYERAAFVDMTRVAACRSYREAVRTSWALRTRPQLTRATLAQESGLHAPHITDYLHEDDSPRRRDLPARYIEAMEIACGNRFISQWIAWRAQLPIALEQLQERRAA